MTLFTGKPEVHRVDLLRQIDASNKFSDLEVRVRNEMEKSIHFRFGLEPMTLASQR